MNICPKCSKSHNMGIENMETGSFEPIDVCYDCMFIDAYTPVYLEEWGGDMCANIEGRVQNIADYLNKNQAALIKKMSENNNDN